jgi:hypothetical protein
MKRGGACGKGPRPILRRRIKGTRILWTSPDERWIFKKGMKCGWTSRISSCPKAWAISFWAHTWVHSKCWKINFSTLTS